VLGHLARAGVLAPAPAPADRAVGQITGGWDRRAAAVCVAAAREAERVRWAQYRSVWEYVEGDGCRRSALLAYFGDRLAPSPQVDCCDVCAPHLAPEPPPARTTSARSPNGISVRGSGGAGDLDAAILDVVTSAQPPVGRTRAVEILRGGRSKVVAQYAYDGLAGYGSFAHLRSEEVLGRVDQLLVAGRLRSTGGRFPKLRTA
jgi:ATP-dependent DNA helicase RecQ